MCSASVEPMPSRISKPYCSRTPWNIRAGSASPAETPLRTVANVSRGRSAAISGPQKLGPPKNSVTPCSAIRSANRAGLGRDGSSTALAPTDSGKNSELPMP